MELEIGTSRKRSSNSSSKCWCPKPLVHRCYGREIGSFRCKPQSIGDFHLCIHDQCWYYFMHATIAYNNKNRADIKCKNESVAILVIVLWDRDSCKGMRVCFVHLHANCVCMCAFVLYVWILFRCVLCVCERQTVRETEGGICVSILSTNRCNIKIMYWFQGSSTSIKNLLIYSSALSSNIYELLFT